MTLDTLQSLTMDDINNMSMDELHSALKYGKRILVTRYNRQKKYLGGDVAPVFSDEKNPYLIETEGLTRQQTVNRLKKVIQTTEAKTTTVTGYKSWRRKQERIFGTPESKRKKTPFVKERLTEEDYKTIWDIYDKLEQEMPSLTEKIHYQKVVNIITEYTRTHKRITKTTVTKAIRKYAIEVFKKQYLDKGDEKAQYFAEQEWNDLIEGK